MKTTTKIKDLKHLLSSTLASRKAQRNKDALDAAITGMDRQLIVMKLDASLASRREAEAAAQPFLKLPPARRKMAETTMEKAEEMALLAAKTGASYSGETRYTFTWTEEGNPSAETVTARGDQYSRSCTYRRTDATHLVRLSPEWAPLLVERADIAEVSARDGMDLIGWHPDGRVCWVKRKGKAIMAEQGYIAHFGDTAHHSTKSQAEAEKGLAHKLSALRAEWASLEQERKNAAEWRKRERRARLVARLCDVSATVGDALAMGFCRPGIEAFQAQHQIGESASLRALMSTGNPSAVRLAIAIARKVGRAEKVTV